MQEIDIHQRIDYIRRAGHADSADCARPEVSFSPAEV